MADMAARGMAGAAQKRLSRDLSRPSQYLTCLDFTSGAIVGGQGDVIDLSGNAADCGVMAGQAAAAWATKGYFATADGSGLGAAIQKSAIDFDLSKHSLIFAFRVKMAAPASNPVDIMGNGSLVSQGGYHGVKVSARTNGKVRIVVTTSAGDTSATISNDSFATVFDGTDHDVLVALDGPKGNFLLFIDGVLDRYYRRAWSGSTAIGCNWHFGTAGLLPTATLTNTATVASLLGAKFHMLRFDGGLPINLAQIAQLLTAPSPRILRVGDVRAAFASWLVSIVGQSNELGSGSIQSRTGLFGAPQADPLPASATSTGGTRSMWPALATMLGERGIWADFQNTAVGSTSIIHNWAGVLRAWANGLQAARGTYVLNGGNVYKNATGTKYQTSPIASTVAPVHTAGTVTGGDGIAWQYMGAARAQDVPGYIYPHTDAYFDPNGYLADALAPHVGRSGYDRKMVFVSIGQGDKTLSTTRAEFTMGYRRVADYFLANGVQVALGFTCYAATAGAEAWYQSDLLPGYADALAYYAGNSNVIAGANLRNALGILAVTNADKIGLQADQLHMNNPTLLEGAKAWLAALNAAGLVPTRLN